MPENPKLLKISILGVPNAGKSMLINRLLNKRVYIFFNYLLIILLIIYLISNQISSVSSKINTTNKKLTGVLTNNDTQLVSLV